MKAIWPSSFSGMMRSMKLNVPIALLPEDVHVGDILDISITIDEWATDDSKTRVSNLMEKLKKKNQEGTEFIPDPE